MYGYGYDTAARLWCVGELTEHGTIATVVKWIGDSNQERPDGAEQAREYVEELNAKELR
jgi:hypothetical protein